MYDDMRTKTELKRGLVLFLGIIQESLLDFCIYEHRALLREKIDLMGRESLLRRTHRRSLLCKLVNMFTKFYPRGMI